MSLLESLGHALRACENVLVKVSAKRRAIEEFYLLLSERHLSFFKLPEVLRLDRLGTMS